jgi:CBS domain-containing protein
MAPAAVANVLAPLGSLVPRFASLALGARFARDWLVVRGAPRLERVVSDAAKPRRGRDVLRWGGFLCRLGRPSREGTVSRVSEILRSKGNKVFQVEGSITVFEAIKVMVEANVGALLVTEDGEITGIMTERDYLRRVTLQGRTDKEALVREIMSSPIIYVTPDTGIDECMGMMTERRIRHLPVMDGDELAGLVSIGDLVKFQSKEQSFQIQYLTEYIGGR